MKINHNMIEFHEHTFSPFLKVRYSASTNEHHACFVMNTDMGTLIFSVQLL